MVIQMANSNHRCFQRGGYFWRLGSLSQ